LLSCNNCLVFHKEGQINGKEAQKIRSSKTGKW
jgi:hypothetical protein